MTYRVDRPLIRAMSKYPFLSENGVNEYLAGPFVHITGKNYSDMWEWFSEHQEEHGELLMGKSVFDNEWMPWPYFNVFLEEPETDNPRHASIDIYFTIQRIEGQEHVDMILWILHKNAGLVEPWSTQVRVEDDGNVYADVLHCPDPTADKDHKLHMAQIALRVAMNLRIFFAWLYYGDHYWVESTPVVKQQIHTPEQLRKKPFNRRDLTTMLALNRLPSQQRTKSEEPSHHKRGHQRRGHWRRLENPRFRNHPKFGQRIWVKPSWIGPTEEVFEGNYYKVFEPLNTEDFNDEQVDTTQKAAAHT